MPITRYRLHPHFDAARTDTAWGKNWNPQNTDAAESYTNDRALITSRCQHVYDNGTIAHAAVETKVTNVVGAGLKFSPLLDHEYLGITEDEAAQWRKEVSRKWEFYCKSVLCDAERQSTFAELTEMIYRSMIVRGDVLVFFPLQEKKPCNFPYATSIRVLEGDFLETPKKQEKNKKITDGVEIDADGAVVAYHVATQHPATRRREAPKYKRIEKYSPTGLLQALHIFDKKRPGQKRGISELVTILSSLKQLEDYEESELTAAVISSYFTVFVKNSRGLGDTDEAEKGGKNADMQMAPGMIVDLDIGEDIVVANPGRPNSTYEPFTKAVIQHIAASLQLPLEVLLKRFDKSFSASRGALNEAWNHFLMSREKLVSNFVQPCYERWLYEAVMIGDVEAAGFLDDPMRRSAWCGASWHGPVQKSLNPLVDVNAAQKRVGSGFSDYEKESFGLTGTSYAENIAKLKGQTEKLNEVYPKEEE